MVVERKRKVGKRWGRDLLSIFSLETNPLTTNLFRAFQSCCGDRKISPASRSFLIPPEERESGAKQSKDRNATRLGTSFPFLPKCREPDQKSDSY